jgi:hypothetical protein
MGCHAMHVFFKTLQLDHPIGIQASRSSMYGGYFRMNADGSEMLPPRIDTPETESYSNVITWDYPERGKLPPLQMIWYDGGIRPHRPIELNPATPLKDEGLLFIGEKGKLLCGYYGGDNQLLPEKRFADFVTPPKTLKRTEGHYKEWVSACKTGSATNVDFDFGGRMTEVAQLGAIAARCARPLLWNAASMSITNDERANAWVNPPYRSGWTL